MPSSPFGISITDYDGKILRKNVRYELIIAGKQEIPAGAKLYDLYKGWFKGSGQLLQVPDYPAMQAISAGKSILGIEIEIQRLDGSFGTIVESAIPIMDDWGRVSGATVVTQEITDFPQAGPAVIFS